MTPPVVVVVVGGGVVVVGTDSSLDFRRERHSMEFLKTLGGE